MNDKDPKQRFFLMMAIGLTMLLVMQYLFPPPPPPPTTDGQPTERGAIPQTAPAAVSADVPVAAKEFRPGEDFLVKVRVGGEGRNEHGYEATFSSVGGGLANYRLLGFFRVPQDDSDANRVILLDRLANGRDSLRVDSVTYGATRAELVNTAMREAKYELVEVPVGAEVTPEAPGVKRGDNLVFRTVVGDWELVRTYRFPKDGVGADFTIPFDLEWRNIGQGNKLLNFSLVGPAGLVADDDSPQFGIINFLTARQPSGSSEAVEIERKALSELASKSPMSDRDNRANLAYVGAKNRFFTAIMTNQAAALPDSNGATRLLFAADPKYLPLDADILKTLSYQPKITSPAGEVPAVSEVSLTVEPGTVAAGGTHKASYLLYAGPAVDALMTEADARLEGVVSYTMWRYFDLVSRWLVRFLSFLDKILGNYGLAIIVMTILIKLILHPLNRKSMVSMNKMSKLAPMMKEIQRKYASDKVKLQQEMGKLYKDNGVSMAGGCLPMFLQLPIFFALYGAFSQGFSMRHAPFLSPWIKDLSKPDSVYDLGFQIPLLNSSHLSLLPILYFVLNYVQMSMQPKPSDPQQAQQQKIMKFMPLMFVFIFYSMPAGLVLYFTVSALCSVIESTWMRKMVLPKLGLGDSPEAAAVAAATAPAAQPAISSSQPKKKKKRNK